MKKFIPYAMPHINMSDKQAVMKTLDSGQLVLGPKTIEFETKLKNFLCAPHVIAVSSGTSALYLVSKALNIDSSVSVIVPTLTFTASAGAFAYSGAEIIFSDCQSDNGLINADLLEKAIKSSKKPVKFLVIVHLGGRIVNLSKINLLSKKYRFHIIEDCCHAFGSFELKKGVKRFIGSCENSIASTFSFHGTKNITCGEGGAIITKSRALYKKILNFRNHGINKEKIQNKLMGFDKTTKSRNAWYYEVSNISLNHKMSELNCALGISQLSRIPKFRKTRQMIRDIYDTSLKKLSLFTKIGTNNSENYMDHLYQVKIEFNKLNKNQIIKKLFHKGIGTQVHYVPLHEQPAFKRLRKNLKLKNSLKFYNEVLSLPFHNAMSEEDAFRVVKELRAIK